MLENCRPSDSAVYLTSSYKVFRIKGVLTVFSSLLGCVGEQGVLAGTGGSLGWSA